MKQITVLKEIPKCPRCGSDEVRVAGELHNKHATLQRYGCRKCGKRFQESYHKPLNSNPRCSVCSSESVKNGFRHYESRKVQKYKCKKCGNVFQESYIKNMNAKPKRAKRKSTVKRKSSVKRTRPRTRFRLKEIPDLTSLSKKPLDVDSVVGIPCFCCEKDPCDPKTCLKLDEWLVKNER